MLRCPRCLLLTVVAISLLWGRGSAAGDERPQVGRVMEAGDAPRQPARRPYPNPPEAPLRQDVPHHPHRQPPAAQPAPDHTHPRAPVPHQQPFEHRQPAPAPAGNQRSGMAGQAFKQQQPIMPHGDGPGRKVDPGPDTAGQSREQHLQAGRGRPLAQPPGRDVNPADTPLHQGKESAQKASGMAGKARDFRTSSDKDAKLKEQNVMQMAYKQQVERRQQLQERMRKQQENIRKQLEEDQRHQLEVDQRHQLEEDQRQDFPRQRNQPVGNVPGPRTGEEVHPHANNADEVHQHPYDDNDLRKHVPPERSVRRASDAASPTRQPPPAVGGAGLAFNHAHNSGINDEAPDAPHGADTFHNNNNYNNNANSNNYNNNNYNGNTNNNNRNNGVDGLSDEFRRGMIRKVYREEDANLNNMPIQRNAFPPEQPLRDLGGMSISWDWDDFSLTFQNYGVGEMKVRRAPHATTGEPWPLPQYYTKKDKNILLVDPNFDFVVSSNITCDILELAMERYKKRIREQAMEDMYDNLQNAEGTPLEVPDGKYSSQPYRSAPRVTRFSLKIRTPCSLFPSMDSDESYDLVVKKTSAYLWANEVWGLLRGLETLSQLIWKGADDNLYMKESLISDYPRFPHRGVLIDSSRHFIFKEVLLDMMDAMEMNKMNVLHWHIVDDQSFPYQSEVFPELSAKGAYHPTFVYSLSDIAEIIEYGRMRGIRILPEFDSPGHTYSWGLSRPELLTQCYSGSSPVKGYLGPIDPVRSSTYHFIKTLFGEILNVFKDEYMHLGGDEVPLGCWQSNPEVVKFGKTLNKEESSPHDDHDQQNYFSEPSPAIRMVYEYYINRVMKDIKDLGAKRNGVKFIMWQEVMNNDLKLPNDTLIQVWMGDMADVSRAIGLGYNVLYSSCWYLDHVEYGVKWPKYYQCDPADASYGYRIDEKKVKGGEACLWSEYIDNESLMQTTWPRASAVAERLWSSKDTRNLDTAGERLSEHRCRMLKRGLSVGQVSGPDYCLRSGIAQGRLRASSTTCQGTSCKDKARAPVETHSDIKFRVRTEGGGSADCGWVGGNITFLLLLLLFAFILLLSLSRSSGKLYTLRTCRHRSILLVFLVVLFIYFMCYTTMWMHVFEFSGSFQQKRHAS